jgi:hypothetical protein
MAKPSASGWAKICMAKPSASGATTFHSDEIFGDITT